MLNRNVGAAALRARCGVVVGSLAAVGAAASAANATVVATFQAYGAGQYASCGYRSTYAWNSSGSVTLFNIRSVQHEFTDASGGLLRTWCAQVYQGLTLGTTYNFNLVPVEAVPGEQPGPMGALRATVMRDLFARWIDASTGLVVGDLADRNAKSAAFQLVVWEITHENFAATDASGLVSQMSLALGAFRSSPTATASFWYEKIRDSLGDGGFLSDSLAGLAHPTAQDQIFREAVPAPGALSLLLLGVAVARRRR